MDIRPENSDDEIDDDGQDSAADRPGWVGPPVVTLCGSIRFWPLMVQVAAAETAAGAIVLAPFVIVPPDEQNTECGDAAGRALKVRLDALHRAKIAMSSSVLVVTDDSGYWGESTSAEIAYAQSLGIPVGYRAVGGDPRVVETPLTGIAAGAWHAAEQVHPPRVPGDPEQGLAVCGQGGVTVAAKFGAFDPDRDRDHTCHECAWTVAIRTGTLDAEVDRLSGADGAPTMAAQVARAIVTAQSETGAGHELDHPYTVQLLAAVSAHAPTPLISPECGEGACEHPREQSCPTVALACLACSQLSGGWAGEWEGTCMPECTVPAPCEVLRTLATHYRITGGAR
ncbi:hypothetical protein [Pseudonocardia nigra]|uniref:hypothetical protein n=1 Tax=Pseudonocardia nigra TaxID=1921578 RepID=UPI001C5FEDBF|nr:hypothetical protein [Pseudonocardia nigra]